MRRQGIVIGSTDPALQALETDLNDAFARVGATRPERYATAKLPKDDSQRLALVTDATGGLKAAYYDTSAGDWTRLASEQHPAPSASGATGYLAPMYLGTYALWVDSTGDLRIKSGAPVSDLDGSVVGTQT